MMAKKNCWLKLTIVLAASVVLLFGATAFAAMAGSSPVKIFVLAGQSNMEGHGYAIQAGSPRRIGTLEYFLDDPVERLKYEHLVDANDDWISRADVWVQYGSRSNPDLITEELIIGLGANYQITIGPELGFGWIIGDYIGNQIVIIKTCWGGKSLAVDFRPPSSGGTTGPYYTQMINIVNDVTTNLSTYYPDYDGQGYEIAGFGWHQGWNDYVNQSYVDEYETNLANLIRDVRTDLGVPNLPFVVAASGMTPPGWASNTKAEQLIAAQEAPSNYPEFAGTVAFVETRDFWREPEVSPWDAGYHWCGNFESYYLVGEAMGEAMNILLDSSDDFDPPTPDPMTWASPPAATGDSSITMTAITAIDAHGVEYYFTCTAGGGNDSGWQVSTTYEDTSLTPDTTYTYTVTARDMSVNQNQTAASTAESATTDPPDYTPPAPDPMTWETVPYATGFSSIAMVATTASDIHGVEYYFTCTAGDAAGDDSGWQDSPSYTDNGLTPNTQYTYTVTARDKSTNQNTTAASTAESATTDDAPPITIDLKGYWPFDGDALDDSGNGHDGTLVNGPGYVTGKLDQAIDLYGPSDQYVTAANPNSISPPWTVSVWVNKQGPPQAYNASGLMDGGTGSDWTGIRAEQYASGTPPKVGITKYQAPDNHNHYWNYALPTGSWAHLVFVCTATGTELYVDNVSQGQLTAPGDSMLVWIDWIGKTHNYGCPMDAYLDDLAVWSRALITDEIAWLYNGGAGNPVGGGPAPDTDPPTPDPATFASHPAAVSDTEITMTATTGSDATGPVEYYFDETSGNPGGTDSGWTTNPFYSDTGLNPSTQYTYTVQMRDSVTPMPNVGTASSPASATTDPASAALPWTEDFETGGFTAGGWTTTGSPSVSDKVEYSGIYGAKIPKTSSIETAISTVGFTGIHVKYRRRTKGFDSGENLVVEWYDGSNWNPLETVQNADYSDGLQDKTCGTAADNNISFRIRFRTNAGSANEYASLDDIEVTGS